MDPSTPPWRALDAAPGPDEGAPASSPPAGGSLRGWVPIACFALAVVLAIAAFFVAASGSGGAVEVDGAEVVSAAEPSGSMAPPDGLLVEVSGAVVRPGVYRLAAGARVVDAIEAAGGFGPRVDTARADVALNLAAPVRDGDEVRVPSRDDPSLAPAPAGAGGGSSVSGGLVDLNTASDEQLDGLPGVGPATVAKIVAARPFGSVEELQSKGVVGEKTLDKLRPLVTVGG